jgi:hypothetical protein
VAQAYLTAWTQERYAEMYGYLSAGAKQAIAQDRFVARYEAIANEATITGVF